MVFHLFHYVETLLENEKCKKLNQEKDDVIRGLRQIIQCNTADFTDRIQKKDGELALARQIIQKKDGELAQARQIIQKKDGELAQARQIIQKNDQEIAHLHLQLLNCVCRRDSIDISGLGPISSER